MLIRITTRQALFILRRELQRIFCNERTNLGRKLIRRLLNASINYSYIRIHSFIYLAVGMATWENERTLAHFIDAPLKMRTNFQTAICALTGVDEWNRNWHFISTTVSLSSELTRWKITQTSNSELWRVSQKRSDGALDMRHGWISRPCTTYDTVCGY